MKNTFKVLLIACMSLVYMGANAQTFIVQGGVNLANQTWKDNDGTYSDDFKSNFGFHLGATMVVSISDVISFEPGLLYSTRGFKEEDGGDKFSVNLNYIDIPLTFKAKFPVSDMNLFVGAGPYAAFAISGKTKWDFGGQTGDEKLNIGSGDDDDIKALDFGLSFGAGAEISTFLVGVSYELGLANISTFTDNGAAMKNKVFKISVGYIIGN